MLDQLRGEIETHIRELLGEADKLRQALSALGSSDGATRSTGGGAPAQALSALGSSDGATRSTGGGAPAATARASSAIDSAPPSTAPDRGDSGPAPVSRPAARTRARARESAGASGTSRPPQAGTQAHTASTVLDEQPAKARPASGATKQAVLAALAGGGAMTATEVAEATGLGRASISTTLSKLAKSGEVAKAQRGYELPRAEPAPGVQPAAVTHVEPVPDVELAADVKLAADVEPVQDVEPAPGVEPGPITRVDPAQSFSFRDEHNSPTGTSAASLPELAAELASCQAGVLRHHCPDHDFSRWIAAVFHDEPVATEVASVEARLAHHSPDEAVEEVRLSLIAALQPHGPAAL